jgi:hypothetical protein
MASKNELKKDKGAENKPIEPVGTIKLPSMVNKAIKKATEMIGPENKATGKIVHEVLENDLKHKFLISQLTKIFKIAINGTVTAQLQENSDMVTSEAESQFCQVVEKDTHKHEAFYGPVIVLNESLYVQNNLTGKKDNFSSKWFIIIKNLIDTLDFDLVYKYLEALATENAETFIIALANAYKDFHSEAVRKIYKNAFDCELKQWRERKLVKCEYPAIWLIRLKVPGKGRYSNCHLYLAIGLSIKGNLKILSLKMSCSRNETENWKSVMEDLRDHGLKDLPPTTGFEIREALNAIEQVYPSYRPVRPELDHITNIFNRLPKADSDERLTGLFQELKSTTDPEKQDVILANIIGFMAPKHPELSIDLLNHLRKKTS